MRSKEGRAADIQQAIADVLLKDWDPIGIKDVPQARDEYDAYVGGVYRLLASGATAKQITAHLVRIEKEQIGFADTDPRMLIPLAEKLLSLDVRLHSDGTGP